MTKMLKAAIEVQHDLPEERQEVIARAILNYASDDTYQFSQEEWQLIDEGLQTPLVPDHAMAQFWNRHRV